MRWTPDVPERVASTRPAVCAIVAMAYDEKLAGYARRASRRRPWRRSHRPQAAWTRRARARPASIASTTLPPSACPGQPPASASVATVTDLVTADLGPGLLHPDLALLPITPMH